MNITSKQSKSQTNIPKMDLTYVDGQRFTEYFLGSQESMDSVVARETLRINRPSTKQNTKSTVKKFMENLDSPEINGESHIGIKSVHVQEDSLAQADEEILLFNKYSLKDIAFFGCDGQLEESPNMKHSDMPDMNSYSSYPPSEYEEEEEEIPYSNDCSFSQLDIEKTNKIPSLFQLEYPNDQVTTQKCLHKFIYSSFDNLSCKEQLLEDLVIEEISSFTQLANFFQTQNKTKDQPLNPKLTLPSIKLNFGEEVSAADALQVGNKTASKRNQPVNGQLAYNIRPMKSCVSMSTPGCRDY
jgi:hypothetical protein